MKSMSHARCVLCPCVCVCERERERELVFVQYSLLSSVTETSLVSEPLESFQSHVFSNAPYKTYTRLAYLAEIETTQALWIVMPLS